MTWQFDEDNLILAAEDITGSFWVILKDLMVLHGTWAVAGSGDGLATFENTEDTAGPYDVLSAGATNWNTAAANTFSHTNSWLRLKETGSTRELLIQRNNAISAVYEDDITIQSSVTGFDSGGASATLAPTATAGDNKFLMGTAVGVEGSWGPVYNIDAYIHVAVQDTAVNGVYPFVMYCRRVGGTTPNGIFIYEGLKEGIVGDPQPFAFYCPGGSTIGNLDFTSLDNTWSYYVDYGGGGETWLDGRVSLGGSAFGLVDGGNVRLFPGFAPPQEDGIARVAPIVIGRNLIGNYKGVLQHLQWKGTTARDYPDTRNLTTVNAQVYVDDVLLPRGQNSVPQ